MVKIAYGIDPWQELRAQYIIECNPGIKREVAYGLAGQQLHLVKNTGDINDYERKKYHWPRHKGTYETTPGGTGHWKRIKENARGKKKKTTKQKKESGRFISYRVI